MGLGSTPTTRAHLVMGISTFFASLEATAAAIFWRTAALRRLRPNHGEHRPPRHHWFLPSSGFCEKSQNGVAQFPEADIPYCHSQKYPVSCRNMQGQESARSLGAVFSVFVELPQPNCQRLRIHQDKICLRLAQLDAGSRHTAIFLHLLTEKSARVHKKLLSFSSLHYSDYNHYNGKRQAPYNIQKWGDAVPISFRPMRQLMESNHISFYRLANEGIDAQTLQRIRHDKPVTTDTLGKICSIMKCQPGDLIEYIEDACEPDSAE